MAVRVMAQRIDRAALLVDNVSKTVAARCGVVMFVSFLAEATPETVDKAVKALLAAKLFPGLPMPPLPEGVAPPRNVPLADSTCDVMLIPQATLAGSLKGKNIQYHGQIAKDEGAVLFQRFVDSFRTAVAPDCGPVDPNGVPEGKEEMVVGAACTLPAATSPVTGRLVVNGTYGNRQGLSFDSPGPFTHVLEF